MKRISLLALAVMTLLATGCNKELEKSFLMVESEPSASDGSKTQLNDERFISWKLGDSISVRSLDQYDAKNIAAVFQNESGSNKAVFVTEEQEDKYDSSTQFIALFPYNENNSLAGGNLKVWIPSAQEYVGDNTFTNNGCPMVAYGGVADGNLSRVMFHNLFGLVRLQICNHNGTKPLESITFEETSKLGITGCFMVRDSTTYNPYLAKTVESSSSLTLKFTKKDCTLDKTPQTFYVALPARKNSVTYNINMTVRAKDGAHVTKAFSVPVKRNALTKMPALDITKWGTTTDDHGEATGTIAGDGTAGRPFLIYSVNDLILIRDSMSSGRSVNGHNLNSERCYYRIMNDSLVLTTENWTKGISFNGYLSNFSNHTNSGQCIVNESGIPLFSEIKPQSSVSGLTVRASYSSSDNKSFSPFCTTNNGTIDGCHLVGTTQCVITYTGSDAPALAGICLTNNGKITGCGCAATLVAPVVAGICYENNGTIQACYSDSPMKVFATSGITGEAAGICYDNKQSIKDCYFSANSSHSVNASWGGIAYHNTGTVERCYVATSGVMVSSRSVGGIVHTMTDGVVDMCWNESEVMNVTGGSQGLGGIVNTLSGGVVRNCIRHNTAGSFTCTSGAIGGVVANLSDTAEVYNSAFYGDMALSSVANKGAFVGRMTGGTIKNCYGFQNIGNAIAFYGSKTGGTIKYCYAGSAGTGITPVTSEDYGNLADTLNDNITTLYLIEARQWASVENCPPIFRTAKKRK